MWKLLILLCLFSLPLYSEYYKLSIGDQLFGLNLQNTIDNARTFNFNSTTPLLYGTELDINYSLLTNSMNSSRVDELSLLIHYKLLIINSIIMEPKLGLLISGNLGGDDLEETLRRFAGEYQEEIPDEEKIHMYLFAGLEFNKDNILYRTKKNKLSLFYNINSDFDIVSSYRLSTSLGYSLFVSGNNFLTSLGYNFRYQYSITDSSTIQYINNIEDEGRINFSIKAGDFQYDLKLYLNGNFATGNYSIIIGRLPEDKKLDHIDIRVIPGIEYNLFKPIPERSLSLSISPFDWEFSRIEFDLKSTYAHKNPGLTVEKKETYYNKVLLGTNLNLIKNIEPYWISPFCSVSFGLENYHYFQDDSSEKTERHPIYELEIGISLFIPQFFLKDNIQYGLNCSYFYRDSFTPPEFKYKHFMNISMIIAIEL